MAEVQVMSLSNFQSVIQLAAGLSFAFSVFPQLASSAELTYERTRKQLNEYLARYLMHADRAAKEAKGLKPPSQEKRKALENLLHAGIDLKCEVERADRKFRKWQEDWSRYSHRFIWSCLFWGILATGLLFVSSQPPSFYPSEIAQDQAQALNDVLFEWYCVVCTLLFLPVLGAVCSGILAKWRVAKVCERLYRSLDELADAVIFV